MTLLTTNPLAIPVIILAVLTAVLIVLVIMLQMKMRRFLVGNDSENIDDSLAQISNDLKELQTFKDQLEVYLDSVEKRVKKSVQSVETVRFNPFKGTGAGGNQSFATAFLTEEGDGVIISSLYSRDHVSIFSKPVKKHASEHELSDEEKEALDGAKKGLK